MNDKKNSITSTPNTNNMEAWFIMKNDEVVGSKMGYPVKKAATLALLKMELNSDEFNPSDHKIVLREFEIVFPTQTKKK